MRIGLFTDSYLPRADGVAMSVESFRLGLEALGHTVFIFCPKRPEPFQEPNNRIYRFASLPSLSYEGYRDTFPFMPKHINFIDSLNLDIIHTFTQTQIGMFGAFLAQRYHIPLVTTCGADFDMINDYKRMVIAPFVLSVGTGLATQKFMTFTDLLLFLKPAYPFTLWLNRMIRVWAAFYNDQCDLTIVPSLKTKHSIAPYMKKVPVVLASGIDLNLVPQHVSTSEFRKEYGLEKEAILFVSSSRLVREKRIDFLIQAFAALPKDLQKKSAFVIIGDGPLMLPLKKLVGDLNLSKKVVFIGRVTNKRVLEIVSACDIYIHASLRETQGLVLNEAAACGKPIIMIDREVNEILHEGKNGFYAQNTLTNFAAKMEVLLTDKRLRSKFGDASYDFSKFTSNEAVSKQLVSLYQQLLKKQIFSIPNASLQEV